MQSDSSKEHAHQLLDRMAPEQLSAVVGLMEVMLDPVAYAIANAPWDDEPIPVDERHEIAASRASFGRGESISNEEVLAEYGLTAEDFERIARTPREPNGVSH